MLSSLRTALFVSPTVRVHRNVDHIWRQMKTIERDWWKLLQEHSSEDILRLSSEVQRKTRSKLVSPSKTWSEEETFATATPPSTRFGQTSIALNPECPTVQKLPAMEHELLHALQNLHRLLPKRDTIALAKLDMFVRIIVADQQLPSLKNLLRYLSRRSTRELKHTKQAIIREQQAYRLGLKRGLSQEEDRAALLMHKIYYQAVQTELRRRKGLPTRLNPNSTESLI